MKFIAIAASAALMAVSAPAFAGNIDLSTLDTAGTATTGSGGLVLTTLGSTFAAGAGYQNQTFALGAGANFDENFTFTIASPPPAAARRRTASRSSWKAPRRAWPRRTPISA